MAEHAGSFFLEKLMPAPFILDPEGQVGLGRLRAATPPDGRVVRETPGIHLHRVAIGSTLSMHKEEGRGGARKKNLLRLVVVRLEK